MEKIGRLSMKKIRNLSIRKTIILYLSVTLILSFVLGYFVMHGAQRKQLQIWTKYMGAEYREQIEMAGEGHMPPNAIMPVQRPADADMSDRDRMITEICDFLQTYSILVIAFAGTVLATFLFYRNKLRQPFTELSKATEAIARQNLDFTISYSNRDELGQVCAEFETMRRQLAENNRRMWNMLENERALRASVSHDIRSPLTILKGYQEMLSEEIQTANPASAEVMSEMLREGMVQIERMERFLDTMNKLSALENRDIRIQEIPLSQLVKQYRRNLEMLSAGNGMECELLSPDDHMSGDREELLHIDVEMVTEVLENLLANAFRYAERKVTVRLSTSDGELRVEVRDDGPGFAESAEVLTKAYYHTGAQDDLTHFGMGLYICRVYCERMGGRLFLGNDGDGGGKAVAVFPL